MPSAAVKIRRVKTSSGKLLSRSLTPHTIAANDKFVFVMARNAYDNFIIRIPAKALRELMQMPKDHQWDATVIDVDPQTTDYTYTGQFPAFLGDEDGDPEDL